MTDDDLRPPRLTLPMICTCSDEGRAEAAALMDEVKRRLGAGSEEPIAEVTDANFLTNVVISLNWDYAAHITEIGNDQWSGVGATTYDGSFSTWVECDHVEHGIAATWKAFADRGSE